MAGAAVYLLLSLLAISLADQNITSNRENSANPIKILDLPKKFANETLKNGTVHVFHRQLDQNAVQDLMRIAVTITNPDKFKDFENQKSPILEVTVSNGRDNFLLKLPVFYPNLTLFSDGKVLEPLIDSDFGKKRKGKNIPENKNSTVTQNLIVTVQSRLPVDVDYQIHFRALDRSQYNVNFPKEKDTYTLSNQHLTFVKPIGFFLASHEQNVREFRMTVTSGDEICAILITLPADQSLYDRRIDSNEVDNRRTMTFTRRADVFFSESEIQKFQNFRIFVFINPDDSACSSNSSRKSVNAQKKISFEFSRNSFESSYFLPVSLMILVFLMPGIALLPVLMVKTLRNQRQSQNQNHSDSRQPEGELISFDNDNHDNNESPPPTPPRTSSVELEDVVTPSDSLSLHGEMLRYPIAIILPVLMHTALEYHKFTTSSMANLDEMCFHNHACAKPLGELRAFNNVISNLGYGIYGLVFVAISFVRRRRQLGTRGFGTYECTLLDVTIGVFMGMQALASAAYHICPSDVAFQFDTPCIQVICGLLIIRQWLVRLETPSAAYSNILLVGIVSLNFMISALSNHPWIRYLIAVLHISTITTFCLSKRTLLLRQGESRHKKIAISFCAAFLLVNTAVIIMYIGSNMVHLNQISTYTFIVNCIMYLGYYTAMKAIWQEKIATVARICGTFAVAMWLLAGYFFLQDDTDWTKTAAASRALNKPCLLLDFFGSHDLWHIFGAFAGLFTFIFVSIIDDDLLNTPNHSVHLF